MRRKTNQVEWLLVVLFLILPVRAQYGGGTGEPNDPYLIYTAEQMNEIGLHKEDQFKHFKLMADIDLSAYPGTAFNMIGVYGRTPGFAGVFDGDGHTISNFTYTSTHSGSVGVFMSIWGPNARINNLGLIDPNIDAGAGSSVGPLAGRLEMGTITNCCVVGGKISGKRHVGGLVGINDGYVANCFSSCSIHAEEMVGGLVGTNEGIIMASYSNAGIRGQDELGGLVGYNSSNAEIIDCYANGSISGRRDVGGFVGNNATGGRGGLYSGTIHHCYSVTVVSGEHQVGGLVGRNVDDGVRGSFWDIETSGQATSHGGTGKTTLEMHDPNTFIDVGWDLVGASGGPGDIWAIPDGGGYPVLWWQLSPLPELPAFSGGTGEPDDPYLIATVEDLNGIGQNPRLMRAHFKLVNDIDLSGVDFFMIANQYYPFYGTFDGDGHTISNFNYTSTETSYVGLFRYVAGAWIRDLGLIGPHVLVDEGYFHGGLVGRLESGRITNCTVKTGSVSGSDDVGGFVGGSSGVIADCSATVSVAGYGDDVGGLVGRNSGTITASYSHASVKGRNAVGGLVGRCSPGDIVNSYAKGDVIGEWYVGGLVGSNGTGSRSRTGTIRHCYSATAILAGAQSGGLLGADWGGEVQNCFWDIETSGRTTSHGGTGKTTAEMKTAGTFLEAGWDFINESANGIEDVWWILEGRDYPRLWWELP